MESLKEVMAALEDANYSAVVNEDNWIDIRIADDLSCHINAGAISEHSVQVILGICDSMKKEYFGA